MKNEMDKDFIEKHQNEINEISVLLTDLRKSKTLAKAYKKFYKKNKTRINYNNKNLNSNKFNILNSRKVELKSTDNIFEMKGRFC